MSTENKKRYSDTELEEFKVLIKDKIQDAEKQHALIESAYRNDLDNGTNDTSPTFKAFDEGSDVMSKETSSQLILKMRLSVLKIKPTVYAE
jgi:hypothetical protein